MALALKTPEEVTALINGQDFAALPLLWKQQTAGQVVGAADVLALTVPVLIARTSSTLEAAFIKALVLVDSGNSLIASAPAAALPWMPSVTSVGDGAPASLERVTTLDCTVPDLRMVYLPAKDQVQDWLLYASTAANATDPAGDSSVQRPLDFHAVNNAKVWFRKR